MRVLRKTWERTLRKALEMLSNNKHPIALYTYNIFKNGTLKIIPFNKLVKKDFSDFLNDYHTENKEKLPCHYPPSEKVINKMVDNWDAKICANRITISHKIRNPKRIAEILVHEANHFLNHSNDNYDTDKQIYAEELRAIVAEKLVFSKAMRTDKLKKIAHRVAKSYEVPLPKEIKMPAGLFVPRKRNR
jgi:hypothetical protein